MVSNKLWTLVTVTIASVKRAIKIVYNAEQSYRFSKCNECFYWNNIWKCRTLIFSSLEQDLECLVEAKKCALQNPHQFVKAIQGGESLNLPEPINVIKASVSFLLLFIHDNVLNFNKLIVGIMWVFQAAVY